MLMVSPCTLELNVVEPEIETNSLEASICSRWIPEYMFQGLGLSKGVDINTICLSAYYNLFTLQLDKHSF